LDFADFKIPVSEVVLYTQFSHKKWPLKSAKTSYDDTLAISAKHAYNENMFSRGFCIKATYVCGAYIICDTIVISCILHVYAQ
jgi:hypothetical protein